MTPVGTRHAVAWTLDVVTVRHTGVAASWCPLCGTCTCPREDNPRSTRHGERLECGEACPLHGVDSTHEEGPVEE